MNRFIRLIFVGLHRLCDKAYSEYKEQQIRNQKNITLGNNVIISKESRISTFGNVSFGDNTWMYGIINTFPHNEDCTVRIGSDCYIGDQTRIWAAQSVFIGNRVLIAHNVNIFDTTTHPIDKHTRFEHECVVKTKGMPNTKYETIYESPVIIEDDVWIGWTRMVGRDLSILIKHCRWPILSLQRLRDSR